MDLHKAVAGFETFEEAQKYAEDNQSTVVLLHRRYGWNLWESKGWASEPIKVTAEDMGDDYESYTNSCDKETFVENTLDLLSDMAEGGVETTYQFVKKQKEIWYAISELGKNEQVIVHSGEYYDTPPHIHDGV